MGLPENIKKIRESRGLSQAEFGKSIGVSDKAVSTWENGLKVPRMGTIQKIADHYGVSKSEVIDGKQMLPSNAIPITRTAPLLGTVRCGEPIFAEQNIEMYIPLPFGDDGHDYFVLRASGDSMDLAGIAEGDMLIVRVQPETEPNEIAIVCVNGDEATAKYCSFHDNMAVLTPKSSDPSNQTQIYDMRKTPVRIMGRVVKIMKDC